MRAWSAHGSVMFVQTLLGCGCQLASGNCVHVCDALPCGHECKPQSARTGGGSGAADGARANHCWRPSWMMRSASAVPNVVGKITVRRPGKYAVPARNGNVKCAIVFTRPDR